MSSNPPKASEIWNEDVVFFSIDTNIIQKASYRFEEGPLNKLRSQLPKNMKLLIPEVILREITKHMLSDIQEKIRSIKSSQDTIKKSIDSINKAGGTIFTTPPFITDEQANKAESQANLIIQNKIEDFIDNLQGEIIHLEDCGDLIVSQVFEKYFSKKAPFEDNNAKKHEFPDAFALEMLKQKCEEGDTKCILVSADKGWKNYASAYDNMFYVESIEALASVFKDANEFPEKISSIIKSEIEKENSTIKDTIYEAVLDHLYESNWRTDLIYSEWPSIDVESEFNEANIESMSIDGEVETWGSQSGIRGETIVKIPLAVTAIISVSCTFYGEDPVDRDITKLSKETKSFKKNLHFPVLLTLYDVNEENDDFFKRNPVVEISPGRYDLGRIPVTPSWDNEGGISPH